MDSTARLVSGSIVLALVLAECLRALGTKRRAYRTREVLCSGSIAPINAVMKPLTLARSFFLMQWAHRRATHMWRRVFAHLRGNGLRLLLVSSLESELAGAAGDPPRAPLECLDEPHHGSAIVLARQSLGAALLRAACRARAAGAVHRPLPRHHSAVPVPAAHPGDRTPGCLGGQVAQHTFRAQRSPWPQRPRPRSPLTRASSSSGTYCSAPTKRRRNRCTTGSPRVSSVSTPCACTGNRSGLLAVPPQDHRRR